MRYLTIVFFLALISQSFAQNDLKENNIYFLNDTITTPYIEFYILNVEILNSFDNGFWSAEAEENNTFICIEYKYKNISKKPLDTFTKPSFKLKSVDKFEFESNSVNNSIYSTKANNGKVYSTINPGGTVHEGLVFEVIKELVDNQIWYLEIGNQEYYFLILQNKKNETSY
jgi:hypothetical protein